MVTCGETLEEALFYLHNVILACEIQIKLANLGVENLHQMSNESIEQVRSIIKSAGSQVQGKGPDTHVAKEKVSDDESKEKLKKWKIWDLEFEAQMRMLDNAVFNYLYSISFPLFIQFFTKNSHSKIYIFFFLFLFLPSSLYFLFFYSFF